MVNRPRHNLPQPLQTHLGTIRTQAAERVAEALSGAPGASEDLLGRIAWYAVVLGVEDSQVVWLIERAVHQQIGWRAIALAVGVPDEPAAVRNLAQQHRRRRGQ